MNPSRSNRPSRRTPAWLLFAVLVALVAVLGVRRDNKTSATSPTPPSQSSPSARIPVAQHAAKATGDFREWAGRYAHATAAERDAMEGEGVQLAKAHRAAMKALIASDPRTALEQAVPMVVRQQLPPSIVMHLERRVSGTGPLEVSAISPDSDPSEPVIRRFATIDGTEYRAWLYGRRAHTRTLPEFMVNGIAVDRELAVSEEPARLLEVGEKPDARKQAVQVCPVSGKSTEVAPTSEGGLPPVTAGTPAVEAGKQIIYLCDGGHFRQLIEDIVAGEGATGGPVPTTGSFPLNGTSSSGIRRMLYMRLTFPDRRSEPQTEAAAYANIKSLTDYFLENSYGRLTFSGTVTPTLMLPRSEAWYIDNYNTVGSNSPIMNDAKEAARAAGYPPEDYQHFTVIYFGGPGSFGGLGNVNGPNAWLKTTAVGTFDHEIGHNLGVWHSNFWNTAGASVIGPGANAEYGHTKDVMGSSSSLGHFNASMKDQLQWVKAENFHTVLGSGTYRLFQFDQANQEPARRYSLKVAKDADRDYWIEFRQKLSTNPWWTNGVSINWSPWGNGTGQTNGTDSGSNNGSQLLDTTPGTPDDREDSPVAIGRTFSDHEAGVHITPVGKGGTTPESLDVVVNVGAFAENHAPTLTIEADATTIAAGGTVNFTATAEDADGDALAYYWEFGDKLTSYNGVSFSTNNSATQGKTYSSAGYFNVRCTVSDMKGGSVAKTLLITAGSPTTFTISGTVLDGGGAPVRDVRVSNGQSGSSMRWAYTDSDGHYTITNVAAGSVTLLALDAGHSFAAGFTNPLAVSADVTGADFTATAIATVSITALDATASEDGDTGAFRITRTGDTGAALTVYTDFSGTAGFSGDYTRSPVADTATASPLELFTIPAGSDTLDITITPANDVTAEGPETVVMSLVNGGGTGSYIPAGPQTATVTIDDNDTTLPRVDIVATTPETTEGGAAAGQFTVKRTGDTSAALGVNFTLDSSPGTALNGADYTLISTTVTIPVGASSAAIDIATINDSLVEGMELVKVTLLSSGTYILGAATTATLKINDDDTNVVSIAATDNSANENGDTGTFTFTRTGDTSAALTIFYAIGGTAMHGADYQPLPGYATFAAGSATAAATIVPIQDSWGEPQQSVILQLRSGTNYQFSGTGSATVNITDDGDLPVVYVAATGAQVTEGSNGTFQFTTTGTGSGNITVRYTISGTATSGSDFNALSGMLVMNKNTTTNLSLSTINDLAPEDAETVALTITPDAAYTVEAQNSATILIRDNEVANMVSVSTTNASVSETASGQFYFSRSGSTTNAITVNYAVGGTATSGTDYTGLGSPVTIAAGTSGTYVTVTPVNDSSPEGAETIVITLLPETPVALTNYGIESGTATMTMSDNDGGFAASVGFAQTSIVRQEDAGALAIEVTRTGDPTGTVTVEYGVQGGTALGNGVDYTCPAGVLTFADGETTRTIPLTIVDDNISEDVETVTLSLRNANAASITAAAAQFTCLILDNEPRVTITANDPFAYETGDTAQFTVRRHGTTSGALVVPIAVSGTATSGTDFTALPSSVTIPNGAATAVLTLTPANDAVSEGVETVIVSLAASSTSVAGPQSGATAYIGDAQSDNAPFIQVASPKAGTIAIPGGVGLAIDAMVADDGAVTSAWSKVSGPGTVTFSAPSQPDTDAAFTANGTYVLRLTADDGTQTATRDITVTVGAASYPWTGSDIGSVGLPGSATEVNGLHAINGAGTSLSGTGDSFFLRSRHLVGNGEIIARVRYVPNTSGSARVGVMLRESTAPGSRSAAMLLQPVFTNADAFNYRTSTNGSAGVSSTSGITPAWWVRLVRSGNSFSAYDSPDGATWTQRGSAVTIAMAGDALAGIAVMSASTSKLNTALVDNVRIIGTPDNTAATVSAGSGGNTLANAAFALGGSMSDDALPSTPGATTVQWSQRSGPGAVNFANANAAGTTATFSLPGSYVVRLTADDGEVQTFAEAGVTATVGPFSASGSTITVASPTVESGTGDVVTFTTRDVAGNQLASGGATVVFSASGGASTGSFGATTDHGDGSYSATFTGGGAGSATTIGATFNGIAVTSTLPAITVTGGVVTVVADDATATEAGPTGGQFTISRTGATTHAMAVLFAMSDTAAEGADFESIGTQAVIPAGAASTTVVITPLADTLAEGDEAATLTIGAAAWYSIGAAGNATVTLADTPSGDWLVEQFGADANNPEIAGANADPDHDGIVNILENALGLNAMTVDQSGNPVLTKEAGMWCVTFTRRIAATDLIIVVEWSENLTSWSSEGVTEEVFPLDATRETVKASVPADAAMRKWFRVRVAHP